MNSQSIFMKLFSVLISIGHYILSLHSRNLRDKKLIVFQYNMFFRCTVFTVTNRGLLKSSVQNIFYHNFLDSINCKLLFEICYLMRSIFRKRTNICYALRNLVLFVQVKKREKHPWGTVNFSKVAGGILQLY